MQQMAGGGTRSDACRRCGWGETSSSAIGGAGGALHRVRTVPEHAITGLVVMGVLGFVLGVFVAGIVLSIVLLVRRPR
jgi:hypothetical protein